MWRTLKAAGRTWPTLSDDPVCDYLVMEAVAVKVAKENEEARKKAEREAWKNKTNDLRQRVGT